MNGKSRPGIIAVRPCRGASGDQEKKKRIQEMPHGGGGGLITCSLHAPFGVRFTASQKLRKSHKQVTSSHQQVPPANSGTGLPEHRVVRRDRQVRHHVQDVSSPHGVPRNHGDYWLGAAPHLYVEVQNPQPRHVLRSIVVTPFPPNPLVSPRAERQRPLPGKNNHSYPAGAYSGDGGGSREHWRWG